jgi:hypothetical protein
MRGPVRRGTIPVEREGGTVYVLLEHPAANRTTTDQQRTIADRPDDRTDALIAELQDRVRSLEEANRENRRIIATLTQRIPELETPRETTGALEAAAPEQERVRPRSDTGDPQEPVPRPSSWRRLFGS